MAATWREAFSDYIGGAHAASEAWVRARVTKNAVDPAASAAAFDGDRMVGFLLFGLDDRAGARTAYGAGAGVIARYRRHGLLRSMYAWARDRLRERGVRRLLLEVIQGNEAALRAYRQAGFVPIRELVCFELELPLLISHHRRNGFTIRAIDRETVASLAPAADWTPSWENGFAAIRRIPDNLHLYGAFTDDGCVGAIAYSPLLNWVMTLLVRRAHRRRGIAGSLLAHLAGQLPDEVRTVKLNDVDRSDSGMLAFLARVGCRRTYEQYEMSCPLVPAPESAAATPHG